MKTDPDIQKDVMAELQWEPALNASEIGVAVHQGVVTLSGHVKFYSEKRAAEKAAKRVKGVKAVALDIEVLLDNGRISDTAIAENIVRALDWNTTIPNDRIRIRVDNAWVYLEGEVERLTDKQAVEEAIFDLSGIRGITNQINVYSQVDSEQIKENIRKALERSADLEADSIQIETHGLKVIIKGSARSWNERLAIEKAAASAPGVTEVINEVAIVY
ncbi:MAG TPA: BON domain-containing protein [Sphingobacteriaceae bacterium]